MLEPDSMAEMLATARAKRTSSDAQRQIGHLAAVLLFAAGLSGSQIAYVGKTVLPLLLASRQLPSDTTLLKEAGVLDAEVARLRSHFRSKLREIPIALFVDGSDTHYCGSKKIIHVMADSAALDHPMLLTVRVEDEASCNAQYISTLLSDVIEEYELDRDHIVGVATDNTAVMPKGVRLAKLTHLPCAVHVIDLMLDGIAGELGFRDLLGWREFVAHSPARRAEMSKAGLNVACCRGQCAA